MDDRARALAEIAALASRHGLTLDEIAAAVNPATPAREPRARGVVVTVLGVLGGTFVFAGIGVFIALQWEDMNAAARVIVTLGSGIAALILSLLAVRDQRFVRAHTPLLLTAAVLQPFGMLVAFDEFGTGGDWRYASLVTSGAMALQFGALANVLGRSTPVFLTMLFGRYVLRYDNAALLAGALAGSRSANPAFGGILDKAESPVPTVPFAITYALANVLLTLLGPLVVGLV